MNDDDDATLLAALAAGVDITGGAVKLEHVAASPRETRREARSRAAPPPTVAAPAHAVPHPSTSLEMA